MGSEAGGSEEKEQIAISVRVGQAGPPVTGSPCAETQGGEEVAYCFLRVFGGRERRRRRPQGRDTPSLY